MLKNIHIGLLLHFYQPWWQSARVLRQIIDECYGPIFTEIVPKMPGFCFTANVNYSLLELLEKEQEFSGLKYRSSEIISALRQAVSEKKIELVGSTAYHPIMPLIPDELQRFHLMLDTELKRIGWQIEPNCRGVFLPEMAFSQKILPNLRRGGYNWTVLDDIPFSVQYNYVPYDHIVSVGGFRLYLRSNYWSNIIAWDSPDFHGFCRRMNYEVSQWAKGRRAYVIIALDGETFGHHHKTLLKGFLEPLISDWGEKKILRPIEEIGQIFPSSAEDLQEINDGSWSTSVDDCWRGDYFPLWKSPYNCHHQDFWRLIDMALKYFGKTSIGFSKFLKITSSCHSWWISGRPWWEPEFMKVAARMAMQIIEQHGLPKEIKEAKIIFNKLISLQ